MKKSEIKKIIRSITAMSVICTMPVISFIGCGRKSVTEDNKAEKLFDEPVTFTIMTYEHPSQQVNPDGLKYKTITELTNVTLDFDITPLSTYKTKKSAAMAAGNVSDITYVETSDLQKYADSGIFLKLDDYLESGLDNFYTNVKDDENWKRTMINGCVYGLTILNSGTYPNGGKCPVIRYDILEKNNIAMPTTFNEWFNVMKQLKTIYPDSTPLSGRNAGINMLADMEYAMGCYCGFGYNPDTGKYEYGALTDKYRPILEFWIKCWNEGIIDKNWATADSNSWDEGVNSNKIFFWYDNAGFAASQTASLQKSNPDALMQIMPLMSNSSGQKRGIVYAKHQYNSLYALSANSTDQDKLIKFMNWCYSDEGMYVCNYGKEGETFTKDSEGNVTIEESVVKKYATASSPLYNWMSDYGLGLLSFTPRVRDNGELLDALGRDNSQFYDILMADYNAGYYTPEFTDVTLASDQNTEISKKMSDVNSLLYTEIRNFIEGKRPITEWNQFVSQLKNAGAEDVVNMYNAVLGK